MTPVGPVFDTLVEGTDQNLVESPEKIQKLTSVLLGSVLLTSVSKTGPVGVIRKDTVLYEVPICTV